MTWNNNHYNILNKSKNKYSFYEGNFSYSDFESSNIAQKLPRSRVGWSRRAIEMRANKTRFDRFENDTLGLNDVFEEYQAGAALNKIKDDILVCGVGFLAVAGDKVMPFTALEATGTYDWRTQNLKDGVAIFKESSKDSNLGVAPPDSYMCFSKDSTLIYEGGKTSEAKNPTDRPLITMLTHKSTAKQPFGRSVLTTPARDAVIDASRTRRQAMIAAYHYNTKVDVILGADVKTKVEEIGSSAGKTLLVGPNNNGQIPQIGQFAQHAMAPFNDSIMICARDFCADTKLNLSNLGLAANAPQSPEALEIVGDDLRDDIIDWHDELGGQIKHLAVTLWMIKNNVSRIDRNLQNKINQTKVSWLPIFKADVSKFGDGLNKIATNAPAIVKQRSVWRNLGLTSREIDDVVASANATEDTGL